MAISPPHAIRPAAVDALPQLAAVGALVLTAAAVAAAVFPLGGARPATPVTPFGGSEHVNVAPAKPLYREPRTYDSGYRLRVIPCAAGAARGTTCFTAAR